MVFLAVGLVVIATGGGVVWIGGIRLSAHSAGRPFVWAVAIAVVRYSLVRQPPPVVARILAAQPPLEMDERRLFGAGPAGFPRKLRELAFLTVAFSALVAIATWPQIAQLHSVSDIGDPLFSVWRLMWVAHELPRNPLNVFNGNQLYPELRTLTFSDPVLAPALLFAPLHALGLHRIVAYNLVLLSGGVFSGVTTFLLVRALTGRGDAAAISGAIFAVYPYRIEHLAHVELQMTMWMPIVLWCLHRALASGRFRDGFAVGLAFAAQFYSALYYGTFLMPYAVVVGAALWLARGRPAKPLLPLAAGALLAALLFSPVARAYLETRTMMGNRGVSEVAFYSAVGNDYLKADDRSLTYGALAEDAKGERKLFPRLTPVLLTMAALWPPLSAARVAYILALAFCIEMSLGMNGSLFPWFYDYVPPFGGIRVPARFGLMAGMTLAILAGYGAARVFGRWPRARRVLLALTLTAIGIESLPHITLVPAWREPPPIYSTLAAGPPSVLAEFPMLSSVPPGGIVESIYVYFSTFHWQKIVNGHTGWLPPSYEELLVHARTFPSDEALDYLRRRSVQYVSVHGAFYPPEQRAQVLDAAAVRTDLELVTSAPWEGSESRLYRVRPR